MIEAGNYPLAVKDLEAFLDMERTDPEDSRSLAEALYQRGVAQAYAGNILESVVPHSNTLVVPEKGKKNQVQRMEGTRVNPAGPVPCVMVGH